MKIKSLSTVFLIAVLSVVAFSRSPYALVLGTAQDAGAPQIGCMSEYCKKAWKNKKLRKLVSSIALIDPDSGGRWIFDATPNFPEQFQMLKERTADFSNRLDGIFLTHAHIGHYTGLMYLGRESMGAKTVKVYAMPRMLKMLRRNAPWSQLVSIKNISLSRLKHSRSVKPARGISVTPFLVPHRDEFSETVGYRIKSQKKSFVFIPDIDKWRKWDKKLEEIVRSNDYVFIDGTFFADGEIPRPMDEVPHPFVSETIDLLKHLKRSERGKVFFTHFNHSNPLLQGARKKIRAVKKRGFNIAFRGQRIEL